MSEGASPQQFGKYVLLERIAMGGMAEIFRAKKLGADGFEKELVIKRVLPHYSEDEAFITMFKDEARIVANLNHANICQVFEFDELDDSFYIAMEYIPGRDLKRVFDVGNDRDFPITVAQMSWIGAQVASGLHYAHTKEYNGAPLNIVHRDVTPHNVMISMGGDVKLMDFGVVKAPGREVTAVGEMVGTVAYMAPEQISGDEVDSRADLYSLGTVLYLMLTGKRPFNARTLAGYLEKHLNLPPRPPREVKDDSLAPHVTG